MSGSRLDPHHCFVLTVISPAVGGARCDPDLFALLDASPLPVNFKCDLSSLDSEALLLAQMTVLCSDCSPRTQGEFKREEPASGCLGGLNPSDPLAVDRVRDCVADFRHREKLAVVAPKNSRPTVSHQLREYLTAGDDAARECEPAARTALVPIARAGVGVLAIDRLVVAGAADAIVKATLAVENVIAAATQQRIGSFIPSENVGAGRTLDLLDVVFDVPGVAATDVGVDHGAANCRFDEDTAVVNSGEGSAVVFPGAAIEEIAVAWLPADQKIISSPTQHRRCAAFATRVKDVDAIENIVAAPAFKGVRYVVIACIDRVVAFAAAQGV